MKDIQIVCDRCGDIVKGSISEDITGGFYDVSKGYWKQFLHYPKGIVVSLRRRL